MIRFVSVCAERSKRSHAKKRWDNCCGYPLAQKTRRLDWRFTVGKLGPAFEPSTACFEQTTVQFEVDHIFDVVPSRGASRTVQDWTTIGPH